MGAMTRETAEKKILEKCKEIAEIVKKYDKNADYFTIAMWVQEGYLDFNNDYWEYENGPKCKILDYHESKNDEEI